MMSLIVPTSTPLQRVPSGTVIVNGNAYQQQISSAAHAIQVSPSGSVFQFELYDGDIVPSVDGPDPNVQRSELAGLTNWPIYDQDIWTSHSVCVLDGDPISADFCLGGQFHHVGSSGSPPFSFAMVPNGGGAERWNCTAYYSQDSSYDQFLHSTPYIGPPGISRGSWINWVTQQRWDPFGVNSKLNIWKNGNQVCAASGFPFGYANPVEVSAYWKFGIYRRKVAETLRVRYANIEVGTSSLLSRVNSPLPIVWA